MYYFSLNKHCIFYFSGRAKWCREGSRFFLADLGGSRFVISMSRVLQNVVRVDEEKHQTPLEIFYDQCLISFTKPIIFILGLPWTEQNLFETLPVSFTSGHA